METYSVKRQTLICRDKKQCYFGNAPTLSDLTKAIDERAATAWLIPLITDLAIYSGHKGLTENQINDCADIIAAEFDFLKLTEVMLYFYYFKTGKYGRFYGVVSPLEIIDGLRSFLRDRASAYATRETEIRMREIDIEKKRAISPGNLSRLKEAHKKAGDYDEWIKRLEREYFERKNITQ